MGVKCNIALDGQFRQKKEEIFIFLRQKQYIFSGEINRNTYQEHSVLITGLGKLMRSEAEVRWDAVTIIAGDMDILVAHARPCVYIRYITIISQSTFTNLNGILQNERHKI